MCRLAPWPANSPFPYVSAVSFGLKGSVRQLAAWKRLATCAFAPWTLEILASIASELQFVGLKKNRSIVRLTVRTRNGTPSTLGGNGSIATLTAAVCGSTLIAPRTTMLPRLNGPTRAGTTTERPNGAPLYGPVRYAEPDRQNGCEPAPAAVVAEPIRDVVGHVPALACGSGHWGTPAILPSRPGGMLAVTPERSGSRSWRENVSVNGLLAPACGSTVPAMKPGANLLSQPVIAKGGGGVAGG